MNYFVFQDKQKYEICLNAFKSCDELANVYVDLCERYPEIKVLIDPFLPHVSKFTLRSFQIVESKPLFIHNKASHLRLVNFASDVTHSSLNENMLQLDVNCPNNRNFFIFQDREGFSKLQEKIPGNCFIINQESFSNNPKFLRDVLKEGLVSGNIMKMESMSTVTQFLQQVKPIEG